MNKQTYKNKLLKEGVKDKEKPLYAFEGIKENFPKLEAELNKLKLPNKPSVDV